MVKRVIIVGGGYTGTALARALDKLAEVQLVDARDRFVHNVAAIRSVADPSLLDRIVIPFDRLLRRGSVRQGLVSDASNNGVTLANGDHIDGDIIVVATGSRYASPFKPQGESTQAFVDGVRATHSALKSANAIAIVGGGAVGTELAGEISSAYPGKAVTLVSGSSSLVPGYSNKLADTLAAQLRSKGVSLRFKHRIEGLAALDHPFTGSLGDDFGGSEQLIFPALGAQPTTDVFRQMPGTNFDAQGRVEVDGWLRLAGFQSIFALGDAAATGDPMTIVAITRQVPWLAKTISALLEGQKIESLSPYKPWPTRGILVPLGPRDGASALPVLRNGLLVGRWLTSRLKGRELFIPRYLKEFGYAMGAKG